MVQAVAGSNPVSHLERKCLQIGHFAFAGEFPTAPDFALPFWHECQNSR